MSAAAVGELIPIGTRLRWMLLCRAGLVAVIPAGVLLDSTDRAKLSTVMWIGAVWFLLTGPTVLAPRINRTAAIAAFNVSLLGDGLVLCALWRALGGLDESGGHLVWLHCAAVTLLASFRTGVKLAVWQGLLALVSLESTAAGAFGQQPRPYDHGDLAVYQITLLVSVLATAAFAAVNERELRRRRYDSDVLRKLAFDLAEERTVDEIAGLLAGFGTHQLLVPRGLVVFYRRHPDTGAYGDGAAVTRIAGDDTPRLAVPDELAPRSVVSRALRRGQTQLVTRLDPSTDAWLTGQLPGASNVIVIPFVLDQIAGALVIEAAKRRLARVEQRIQDTAEQATALAAMALGRAVLTERVRAAADTDGLTGLANRRLFDIRIDREVARARANGERVGLLMVDLDHFKRLNDRYGHQTGDEVLRQAAHVLAEHAHDGSLAARYGGEEFAIILIGAAAETDVATGIAEDIRRSLWQAETVVPVTASLGLAVLDGSVADAAALIKAADEALYEAKAHGRDRVALARGGRQLVA